MTTIEKAVSHNEEMQKTCDLQISVSIAGTKIYGGTNGAIPKGFENCADYTPEVVIENLNTVDAIMKYGGQGAAVLNFASYGSPCSGYLLGAINQECTMCNTSFLYNVLSDFPEYYRWNKEHYNRGLFEHRAIYTPYIIFEKDGKSRRADVISCTAPKDVVAKTYDVSELELRKCVNERIDFILKIAEENRVNTLILGAWGCGSFGGDATALAKSFKAALKKHSSFSQVIFAISDSTGENLEKFNKVFTKRVKNY